MNRNLLAALLCSASAFAFPIGSATAADHQGGGHFVSGHGTLGKAAQSLTVNQSSTTGIIDWSNFSVGKHESVTFDNGNGATLNRVTGGDLSRIAGSLHATGSLYLQNDSGVIVSSTGHVVTGGNFVASSANIAGSAFGSDERLRGAHAAIVNRGSLVSGGDVSLVGGIARNIGTIIASSVTMRAEHGEAVNGGAITATGNPSQGGHILLIAVDGKIKVAGALVARNSDGSGGTIETSGRHLSIAGHIDAGEGGTWLVDPENLTVDSAAATTIDNSLNAGTNVTLKTAKKSASGPGTQSSGAGDIIIDSALSWNTSAKLTLDAYHSVLVDNAVSVTNGGSLMIDTRQGELSTMPGGQINFSELTSSLVINGQNYLLVNSIGMLANDISVNSSANYALVEDIDASGHGPYRASPISTFFSGTFEGLGHTISGLKISERSSSAEQELGLFADLNGGEIRDLALTNLDIIARHAAFIGGLVGENEGIIDNVSVTGTMTAQAIPWNDSAIGLLEGYAGNGKIVDSNSQGTISGAVSYAGGLAGSGLYIDNSWADVVLDITRGSLGYGSDDVGGLVGVGGFVENSHAIGDVSGDGELGGMMGRQIGGTIIRNSYATGDVFDNGGDTAIVGGFVGEATGKIEHSYETGSVTSHGTAEYAGGFVGAFFDGSISDSYEKGSVTIGKSNGDESDIGGFVGLAEDDVKISDSYAAGAVTAEFATTVGGFVGDLANNDDEGSEIINSYAAGAVHVRVDGENDVGGFAGQNDSVIKSAYATGLITITGGSIQNVGGFVGYNAQSRNIGLRDCYWDTQTTGIAATKYGGKGVTSAELKADLLPGLSSSVWGSSPDFNDGLPYLLKLASSY